MNGIMNWIRRHLIAFAAEVRQEMIDFTGTQFDPLVVEAFLRVPPEDWRRIRDAAERLDLTGADFGSGIL